MPAPLGGGSEAPPVSASTTALENCSVGSTASRSVLSKWAKRSHGGASLSALSVNTPGGVSRFSVDERQSTENVRLRIKLQQKEAEATLLKRIQTSTLNHKSHSKQLRLEVARERAAHLAVRERERDAKRALQGELGAQSETLVGEQQRIAASEQSLSAMKATHARESAAQEAWAATHGEALAQETAANDALVAELDRMQEEAGRSGLPVMNHWIHLASLL